MPAALSLTAARLHRMPALAPMQLLDVVLCPTRQDDDLDDAAAPFSCRAVLGPLQRPEVYLYELPVSRKAEVCWLLIIAWLYNNRSVSVPFIPSDSATGTVETFRQVCHPWGCGTAAAEQTNREAARWAVR
jgi:hypothetical protein